MYMYAGIFVYRILIFYIPSITYSATCHLPHSLLYTIYHSTLLYTIYHRLNSLPYARYYASLDPSRPESKVPVQGGGQPPAGEQHRALPGRVGSLSDLRTTCHVIFRSKYVVLLP